MSESAKVDEWMANADNPFKDLWEIIRRTVLNTDPKMEEDIKWGAPTFMYKGNLATFNPRAKKDCTAKSQKDHNFSHLIMVADL